MGQVTVNPGGTNEGGMGTGMILGIILTVLIVLAIGVFYAPRFFMPSEGPMMAPIASQGPMITAPGGGLPSVRPSP